MTASSELISRLQQVPFEERSWVTLSMLLESVGPELASMIWAASVVHWFTPEILAALRPELEDQAEASHQRIQKFQFVKETDEGSRLHEQTRSQLLGRLASDHPQDLQTLSARAAEYFSRFKDPISQSLKIYHRLVSNPEQAREELFDLASQWLSYSRQTEIMVLLGFLNELVLLNHVSDSAKGDILIWQGKAEIKFIRTIGILNQHNISDAREYFERALSLYKVGDDRWGKAQALQGKADVLLFLDHWQEALDTYQEALRLHQDLDDPRGRVETLMGLGHVLQFLDRRDEALSQYEQALSLYESNGDRLGKAVALQAIGDLLQFLDRHDEALSQYEAALSLYESTGARLGEANTLRAIGDLLQFQDRRDEALSQYEQALSLYESNGARLGEANTLRAIGDLLQFQGRHDEALSQYEQALSLYESNGDRLGKASALQVIGDLLRFQDHHDEALSQYQQALSLYESIGDRRGEANTLQAVGDLLQFLDRRDEALSQYQQALSLYKSIGDRRGKANVLQAIRALSGGRTNTIFPFTQYLLNQPLRNVYGYIGDGYRPTPRAEALLRGTERLRELRPILRQEICVECNDQVRTLLEGSPAEVVEGIADLIEDLVALTGVSVPNYVARAIVVVILKEGGVENFCKH